MDKKRIHMVGIGGVSMSGIAHILKHFDYIITGSDQNESDVIEKLRNSGIPVKIGHDLEAVRNAELVIYTAAVKQNDIELVEARNNNIQIMERADFLGELTKEYEKTICISGTHGKTTTTSMVALCFLEEGLNPTIQVGAKLKQIDGNYYIGDRKYFILEACEYVESFLKFHPQSEIILNIDNDHLDYFKTFENVKKAFEKFINLLPEDGILVINADDDACLNLKTQRAITYGIKNENADFVARNIVMDENGFPTFDVYHKNNKYFTFKLSAPGLHNVSNALSCIALCNAYNVSKESIYTALNKFTGANRRFEYIGSYNGANIYDDYAHHPTEIKATAKAMTNKKYNESWAIFQSHTYSRTFNLLDEFVEALIDFDNIIITDIYPAREENIYGVHPEQIVEKLQQRGKNAKFISGYDNVAEYIKQIIQPKDLVLTIGAGPIVKVAEKIVEKIEK